MKKQKDGFDVAGNLYHKGKLVDHRRCEKPKKNEGFIGACRCHVGLGIDCPIHGRRFAR